MQCYIEQWDSKLNTLAPSKRAQSQNIVFHLFLKYPIDEMQALDNRFLA